MAEIGVHRAKANRFRLLLQVAVEEDIVIARGDSRWLAWFR